MLRIYCGKHQPSTPGCCVLERQRHLRLAGVRVFVIFGHSSFPSRPVASPELGLACILTSVILLGTPTSVILLHNRYQFPFPRPHLV